MKLESFKWLPTTNYEFDSQGNWTKRLVWIWRSASGERKLHEVDMRTLTYWK